MLNRYSAGGSKVWAVQVYFVAASGKVHSDNDGGELALVKGRWVKIRVVIDLDADVQKLFYDANKFNLQLYLQRGWHGDHNLCYRF